MRHCRLQVLLAAVIAFGAAAPVLSQSAYPAKPIRMVVPYAPGGGSDIVARIIGHKMSESFGQSIVVDNRAGAAGLVGTELAARAAADGYTLLLADSSFTINGVYYRNAKYDPLKDFARSRWSPRRRTCCWCIRARRI